jgi:periplasmic copper chaperone A
MKPVFRVCLVLLMLGLSACTPKPAAAAGSIQIFNPWAVVAKAGGTSGAFMLIKNTGSQPDRLVKVDCMVSMMTGIHETRMENNVMTMTEIPSLEIPANGQVELKEGSFHIMMMKVTQDLNEGDRMKMTLTFEKAGPVEIEAIVKK